MTAMLVAVVGASGVGKDTLMAGARERLAGHPRLRWVRRSITRPAEAGGEDHEPLDPAGFLARRAAGGFALWWEAHGLLYGIPAGIEADLAAGYLPVANLSRGVLAEAAARYPLVAIEITALASLRAHRLADRGREPPADREARLSRRAELPPGLTVHPIANDGSVAQGIARLAGLLEDLATGAALRRPAD